MDGPRWMMRTVAAAVFVAIPMVAGCESQQQREEIARLNTELTAVTQERSDAQKRVEELTQENSQLSGKVDELAQKVSELEQAVAKAQAKPAAKAPAKARPASTKR